MAALTLSQTAVKAVEHTQFIYGPDLVKMITAPTYVYAKFDVEFLTLESPIRRPP